VKKVVTQVTGNNVLRT